MVLTDLPGMRAVASVLIIEDHQLLAQSLSFALSAEGLSVTVTALDSVAAVTAECERLRPQIVLLDLDLGERIGDGAALVGPLQALGTKVLVVTGSTDRMRHATCLELGAAGVLPKSTPYDQLVDAVLAVAAGHPVMRDAERQTLLAELRAWRSTQGRQLAPFEQLTAREAAVLAELMNGRSCEAIARAGYVSEATVRTQIRGVLTKLGVPSQLAAVAQAQRAGWRPTA
jgi:DNA-binding NarL/FixJ family response regulator